jgi:hypothetical protein
LQFPLRGMRSVSSPHVAQTRTSALSPTNFVSPALTDPIKESRSKSDGTLTTFGCARGGVGFLTCFELFGFLAFCSPRLFSEICLAVNSGSFVAIAASINLLSKCYASNSSNLATFSSDQSYLLLEDVVVLLDVIIAILFSLARLGCLCRTC